MKTIHLLLLAITGAAMLTSCATLNRDDRYLLEQHRVSPVVYDKMLHIAPLALPDIVELSQKKLPPPFIVHYVRSTRAVYQLSGSDVAQLRKSGVSREVINYLLATPAMYAPRPYSYPYYGPYPYYYPYGYTSVTIGRPYYHHRHGWH